MRMTDWPIVFFLSPYNLIVHIFKAMIISFLLMAGRCFDPGDRLEVCPLGALQIRPRYRPRKAEQPSGWNCPFTNNQFQPCGAGMLPAATTRLKLIILRGIMIWQV